MGHDIAIQERSLCQYLKSKQYSNICTGGEVTKTVTNLKILYDQIAGCFQEQRQSTPEVTSMKWPTPKGIKIYFSPIQSEYIAVLNFSLSVFMSCEHSVFSVLYTLLDVHSQ